MKLAVRFALTLGLIFSSVSAYAQVYDSLGDTGSDISTRSTNVGQQWQKPSATPAQPAYQQVISDSGRNAWYKDQETDAAAPQGQAYYTPNGCDGYSPNGCDAGYGPAGYCGPAPCGQSYFGQAGCGFGPRRGFGCGLLAGYYLSADYGYSVYNENVIHIGNIANRLGGTPTYNVNDATVVRVGIGKRIRPCVRFEVEGSYRSWVVSDTEQGLGLRNQDTFSVLGSRDTTTVMFNLFKDFGCGKIRPFVKAGAGISYNQTGADYSINVRSPAAIAALGLPGVTNLTNGFPRDDEIEFAWSAGGGFGVQVRCNVYLDFEYQYVDVGGAGTAFDANGDALSFGDGFAHEATVGLRWEF